MLAEKEIACGTRTQRGLPGASLSTDLDHCRRILLSGQSVPFWKPKEAERALPNLGHVKIGIHVGQHVSHLAAQLTQKQHIPLISK